MPGVDAPKVKRWPLAHQYVRYRGEWVAAVVAESRALAEDAAELVEVDYEPLTPVTDPEAAFDAGVAADPSRSRLERPLPQEMGLGHGR